MAEAINCCYARTAVRTIAQKLYMEKEGVKTLSTESMTQLIKEYMLCLMAHTCNVHTKSEAPNY